MTFSYLSCYNALCFKINCGTAQFQGKTVQCLIQSAMCHKMLYSKHCSLFWLSDALAYDLVPCYIWWMLSGCLERNMVNKEDTEDIGDRSTRPIVSQRLFPRVASQPGAGTGDN